MANLDRLLCVWALTQQIFRSIAVIAEQLESLWISKPLEPRVNLSGTNDCPMFSSVIVHMVNRKKDRVGLFATHATSAICLKDISLNRLSVRFSSKLAAFGTYRPQGIWTFGSHPPKIRNWLCSFATSTNSCDSKRVWPVYRSTSWADFISATALGRTPRSAQTTISGFLTELVNQRKTFTLGTPPCTFWSDWSPISPNPLRSSPLLLPFYLAWTTICLQVSLSIRSLSKFCNWNEYSTSIAPPSSRWSIWALSWHLRFPLSREIIVV